MSAPSTRAACARAFSHSLYTITWLSICAAFFVGLLLYGSVQ